MFSGRIDKLPICLTRRRNEIDGTLTGKIEKKTYTFMSTQQLFATRATHNSEKSVPLTKKRKKNEKRKNVTQGSGPAFLIACLVSLENYSGIRASLGTMNARSVLE